MASVQSRVRKALYRRAKTSAATRRTIQRLVKRYQK